MPQLKLSNGKILSVPKGTTPEQMDEIVDHYYSTQPSTPAPAAPALPNEAPESFQIPTTVEEAYHAPEQKPVSLGRGAKPYTPVAQQGEYDPSNDPNAPGTNPGLAGLGHTIANIGGVLTGEGTFRQDPQAEIQRQIYGQGIGQTGAATTSDILGSVVLTAPFGAGTAALVSKLPFLGGASAAPTIVRQAASSAVESGLVSPEDTGTGAAIGGALGTGIAGIPLAARAIGKAVRAAKAPFTAEGQRLAAGRILPPENKMEAFKRGLAKQDQELADILSVSDKEAADRIAAMSAEELAQRLEQHGASVGQAKAIAEETKLRAAQKLKLQVGSLAPQAPKNKEISSMGQEITSATEQKRAKLDAALAQHAAKVETKIGKIEAGAAKSAGEQKGALETQAERQRRELDIAHEEAKNVPSPTVEPTPLKEVPSEAPIYVPPKTSTELLETHIQNKEALHTATESKAAEEVSKIESSAAEKARLLNEEKLLTPPPALANKATSSIEAKNILERYRNANKSIVKAAWKKVPKDIGAPIKPLRDKIAAYEEDTIKGSEVMRNKFPMKEIKDIYSLADDEVGGITPIKQFQDLRSELLEQARSLREGEATIKDTKSAQTRESIAAMILDHMKASNPTNTSYQKALSLTAKFHATYGPKPTPGLNAIVSKKTLPSQFLKKVTASPEQVDEYLKLVSPIHSPDPSAVRSLREYVVNKGSSPAWAKENTAIIDKTPGARKAIDENNALVAKIKDLTDQEAALPATTEKAKSLALKTAKEEETSSLAKLKNDLELEKSDLAQAQKNADEAIKNNKQLRKQVAKENITTTKEQLSRQKASDIGYMEKLKSTQAKDLDALLKNVSQKKKIVADRIAEIESVSKGKAKSLRDTLTQTIKNREAGLKSTVYGGKPTLGEEKILSPEKLFLENSPRDAVSKIFNAPLRDATEAANWIRTKAPAHAATLDRLLTDEFLGVIEKGKKPTPDQIAFMQTQFKDPWKRKIISKVPKMLAAIDAIKPAEVAKLERAITASIPKVAAMKNIDVPFSNLGKLTDIAGYALSMKTGILPAYWTMRSAGISLLTRPREKVMDLLRLAVLDDTGVIAKALRDGATIRDAQLAARRYRNYVSELHGISSIPQQDAEGND